MTNEWLCSLSPRRPHGLRLVALPYAGGGPGAYRAWVPLLPRQVELWAAQPPGREARALEPALGDLRSLVGALANALVDLPDAPLAFFGHSMGALLAFELARELRARGRAQPLLLIVSGRRAPHLPPHPRRWHLLPDDELIAALQRLGGTPPGVLENPELRTLLLPGLRADLAACETYRFEERERLECPLLVVGGDADPTVPVGDLREWRHHTAGSCEVHLLPGSHFFLHTARDRLLGLLAEALTACTGAAQT